MQLFLPISVNLFYLMVGSEVSLGAQIVSKSQANIRGTNITRTDLGRHSLKLNKSLSTLELEELVKSGFDDDPCQL
jgi:hypothetical protein